MQRVTEKRGMKACPFFYSQTGVVSDCLKEGCEMWIEENNSCAIVVTAKNTQKL